MRAVVRNIWSLFMFYVVDELWFMWDYHTAHRHTYRLDTFALYKGEPRQHKAGVPVVAWFYECRCGKYIVELSESGVWLLGQGVKYEDVIKDTVGNSKQ